MSQNTMINPSDNNGVQSEMCKAPMTCSEDMAVSSNSIQEARVHPISCLCSVTKGEMSPIEYGVPAKLFSVQAIEASVSHPDGLRLTREMITNAFYGQWGLLAERFKSQEAVASQEVQRLEVEQMRLAEIQLETPLTRNTNSREMPTGVSLWGWWGLILALVVLNVLAVTNAAAYFRFQAQGWFVAVLMAAPLLFVSFPVKLVMGKLRERARVRVGWSLSFFGVVAFTLFVFTLAVRANPPSTSDILDGIAQMGSGMVPWQLASQIILEFVIATALWYWLLELMASNSKLVLNDDADLLSKRMAVLHSSMDSARSRLAEAQGRLKKMQSSLNYWIRQAEIIFNTYLENHQRLETQVVVLNNWPNL